MNLLIKVFVLVGTILMQNADTVIKLNGVPDLFSTDKMGNIYVSKGNLLTKISPEGKMIGQFSSYDVGPLFSIDTSDPLQVLLFYKDFNQIIFLDSRLNTIGNPIYLDQLDLSSVSAVCKSKEFAVWIYDEYNRKLVHYGFSPKKILQTINFEKFANDMGSIEFIQESGNEIYLKEKDKIVWVFDQFGGKLNKIEIAFKNDFQLRNKMLFYSNNQKIFWYNLQLAELDSLQIEGFTEFDKARIENDLIYVWNSDSITLVPFNRRDRKR